MYAKTDRETITSKFSGLFFHSGKGVRRFLLKCVPFLWVLILLSGITAQFWLGFQYESNDTTNWYLRLARGTAYSLLLLLCLLWLPILKSVLTKIQWSQFFCWLPLSHVRRIHRWLGYSILVFSIIHACCYLFYYNTLESPFLSTLLGKEPDLVRVMKTTMYEFVSEDESIEEIALWIAQGHDKSVKKEKIYPVIKEDCTKCHNTSSTMTYAIPSIPLSTYQEVKQTTQRGVGSRQFRINASGILMLFIMVVIGGTSIKFFRQYKHHLFQSVHKLSYALVLIALIHIPRFEWFLIPAFLLLSELIISNYVYCYRRQNARLIRLNDSVLTLIIKKPEGFNCCPGHSIQLRVPQIKRYEWHYFSLTGEGYEYTDCITLKIKVSGDWTRLLSHQLNDKNEINIKVDIRGPYFTPASVAAKNTNWIMVAGGIGITPFLSLMTGLIKGHFKVNRLDLIWVVRDSCMLKWLQPFIRELQKNGNFHLFVTDKILIMEEGVKDDALASGMSVNIKNGRPDFYKLIFEIEKYNHSPQCFVCGPDAMNKIIKKLCKEKGWRLSVEQF